MTQQWLRSLKPSQQPPHLFIWGFFQNSPLGSLPDVGGWRYKQTLCPPPLNVRRLSFKESCPLCTRRKITFRNKETTAPETKLNIGPGDRELSGQVSLHHPYPSSTVETRGKEEFKYRGSNSFGAAMYNLCWLSLSTNPAYTHQGLPEDLSLMLL